MLARTAQLLLLTSLIACGGEASNTDVDAGQAPDAGQDRADAGPMVPAHNSLISVFSEGPGWIELEAVFKSAALPEIRTEVARTAQCRWMNYTPEVCDPECNRFSELCIEGTCRPDPIFLERGSIDWVWPGGQTSIEPNTNNSYYEWGTANAHGVSRVTVEGETLMVETLAAPVPTNDWRNAITNRIGDVVLRWENPIAGARVRLFLTDCDGAYGGIGETEIECEGPDTGELRLPDEFLTAFEAGEWSRTECGFHTVIRYNHVDSADGSFRFEAAGAVELTHRGPG